MTPVSDPPPRTNSADHQTRPYTRATLASACGATEAYVRRWTRRGYLAPGASDEHAAAYDFTDARIARRLAELSRAGHSLAAIDALVDQLARAAPELERPLADLSFSVEDARVVIHRDGERCDPSGQRLIAFESGQPRDEDEPIAAELLAAVSSLDELRVLAEQLEDQGDLEGAAEALRGVLLSGRGRAHDHFALGALLYRMGDLAGARERYSVCLEADEGHLEARMSLGCVYEELGQLDLAASAFRGVLAQDPERADAKQRLERALAKAQG